jgi:acyl-CoA hydrolase
MALLLASLLMACSGGPRHEALPPGATVLVLGDSLSYGTGAARGQDYPSMLAASTGWNIINAGVPGDTTAGGLERLPELLELHTPQLLLIELGGNDFLRHIPVGETESNLRAIIAQAKNAGIVTLLVAIPTPSLLSATLSGLSDDPLFEKIAADTDTLLISDVLSDVLSEQALKSDTVHANAAGYRQVAEGMHTALQDLGFAR